MNGILYAFAGLVVGFITATFVVFCVLLLRAVKGLNDNVGALRRDFAPIVSGTTLPRLVEGVSVAASAMPAVLQKLDALNGLMEIFNRALFHVPGKTQTPTPGIDVEIEDATPGAGSSFTAYSESDAAFRERQAEARAQGFETNEQFVPPPSPDQIVHATAE